jgi:NADPH-dependent 2,4-dienoyl-CoA reductase/sulfur reductase-like enzyme/rhodanese-related sulfurtransferase/two-component sensor histidine kinase
MTEKDAKIEKLQNELDKYREELSHLIKERSEYLRVSAHQLKSPIATILFSVDTLLGDYAGPLNSKQLRVVESIRNGSQDLQSLIMDILELERFRSGEVNLEKVDFTEISIQAIDELRDEIQAKNIDFISEIPRKILIISGNLVGLKHAVYNLLDNAVKYSERGSYIRYTVSHDEVKKSLSVKVEDSGIGIPEDEQRHVFEEFFRASNARLYDKRGTGFGMTLVKQIIDICGGTITIDSKENEGTSVALEFALLEAKDPAVWVGDGGAYRRRIVVIGGVAAGPKAASRARRLDPEAKITVFEKGNFLAYAGCALPYYISGQLKRQRDLFQSLSGLESAAEFFRNVKGIEIKNLCLVSEINREHKTIEYREVLTERTFTEPYDALIIATGSKPYIPDIPGSDLRNIFVLHGMADSENIKGAIANNIAKDIVILGGGKIGVETAEALTVTGARVTIIEIEPEILHFLDMEMAALVRKHLELNGIRVLTNEEAKAFLGKDQVQYVKLSHLRILADVVIIATGFQPNIELAQKAGLKIGTSGAISVNEYLQTNDPSIYAAGDCTEVISAVSKKAFNLPLGSIANSQGRVAGSNAAGAKQKFNAVTGTTIIKVFNFHFAKTGLNEKQSVESGFDPVTVYVPDYDRDAFIPDAKMISIKMIADRKEGKILGVQIVGKGEVAKRIDVASTIIAQGGTVEDVVSLDLGYAPAYSQAIDIIIVAAHVMQNKIEGIFKGIGAFDAQSIINSKKRCTCIDVRSPQEFEAERIPGVVLFPLESLRRRIDEIPRDRDIILVDNTGVKSYQAALILQANGFKNVRILEGGMSMWPFQISRE